MDELFFVLNGKFFRSGTPVIKADNRGLRYGDGLFETMRVQSGKLLNIDFHFERLFHGLSVLQFDVPKMFNRDLLLKKINYLLERNAHQDNARVRLMIFRGEGGVFDPQNHAPNYIIETWSIPEIIELNENGLVVDVFPDARKSCDLFSNLKSNNYLVSAMAALFAKKNKLNDAIVLNVNDRVCESAIANLFIIKDQEIFTPPLSEGCVAGVTRRWLLEKSILKDFAISEKALSINDLLEADELFLTNSIRPMRWVKNFGEKVFENKRIREIYKMAYKDI